MEMLIQVCTQKQARELKSLGIVQRSVFYRHVNQPYGPVWLNTDNNMWVDVGSHDYECDVDLKNYMISAFTVSELAAALRDRMPYWIEIWQEWGYREGSSTTGTPRGYSSLAEAAAELLIYRLQNGKITADEVNKRLQS